MLFVVVEIVCFAVTFSEACWERFLGVDRLDEEEATREKRERNSQPRLELHCGRRTKDVLDGKAFITKLSDYLTA